MGYVDRSGRYYGDKHRFDDDYVDEVEREVMRRRRKARKRAQMKLERLKYIRRFAEDDY